MSSEIQVLYNRGRQRNNQINFFLFLNHKPKFIRTELLYGELLNIDISHSLINHPCLTARFLDNLLGLSLLKPIRWKMSYTTEVIENFLKTRTKKWWCWFTQLLSDNRNKVLFRENQRCLPLIQTEFVVITNHFYSF